MTMNINLPPQLEEMVRRKVASGLYSSASEVVREGLRLIEEREAFHKMKLEALRAEIQKGLDSGPATPWDPEEVKKEGRKRLAEYYAQKKRQEN